MCNALLSPDTLPESQKRAIVRPLLKRPKLDPDDLNSYRPISNLTFTTKLAECVVAARFMKDVDDHTLLSERQSANHRFHLNETAITALHNDLIRAADVLLDRSSAFDTVDHDILLSVPERRFGDDGVALRWFQSYLQDRSQTFMVNGRSLRTHRVDYSVPWGSCLGSVEFITYTESVASVFGRHNINHRLFADDKQSYASIPLEGVDDVRGRLRDCITDVSD